MRWRTRLASLLIATAALFVGQPAELCAQGMNVNPISLPSGLGGLSMAPGQLMGTGQGQKPVSDAISISDSYVSFIDAAAPRSTIMLRFDSGYNNPQPTRAEYFLSKGGLPSSPGFPQIE